MRPVLPPKHGPPSRPSALLSPEFVKVPSRGAVQLFFDTLTDFFGRCRNTAVPPGPRALLRSSGVSVLRVVDPLPYHMITVLSGLSRPRRAPPLSSREGRRRRGARALLTG